MTHASIAIRDSSDATVRETETVLRLADGTDIDFDLCSKIRLTHSHNIGQTPKLQQFITFCIRHYDDFAPSSNEFMDSKIFEVPAVGNIHKKILLVSSTEQFANKIVEAKIQSGVGP